MNEPKRIQRKVQVWIVSEDAGEDRVLLLRTGPDRGSYWQPVTGSVEEGESDADAALREAAEETGIRFQGEPQAIGYEFDYNGRWGLAHEVCYVLTVEGCPEVRIDPKEHVRSRWVDLHEAMGMLHFETNREALDRLLAVAEEPE